MKTLAKRLAAAAVLVGILCPGQAAHAQNRSEPIDTSKVYQLEEIIISASRWEQSPETVGRNVTVISRREIDSSIHTSVGGLLAEQQGLHVVGNRQTPGSSQSLFLRNTDSNQSVVMIDGVRISDPSSPGNAIDLSELSLAGVERIEIVRGSHSTLYGSSAIGGIINIITRNSAEEGFAGSLTTGHGTFGKGSYSTQNNLALNYATQGGAYIDFGMAQEMTRGLDATVDTVSNPGTFNPQDKDDFNKLDLNGKVGYKGDGFKVYASYRRADQAGDLDQSAYVDDDNARIDFRRNLYGYGASYDLSDRTEIRFTGAWSELNRDFVNDSSVVDASGNYDGTYTETRGEGTVWENELTAHLSGDAFSSIVGAGRSSQTMSTYSYTYSSAFNFESESDLDSLGLKETIHYAFAKTELNGSLLSDGLEAFSLGLGARISRHNEFGTHFTYEINPTVRISSSSLVYAALTTGFNAPSLYQLYSPAEGFGAHTNRGNTHLEPETSVSIEAGWKQDIGSSFRLKASLFRTALSNTIEYIYLWDGNTAIENLSGGDYLGDTYINISEQVINGAEIGVEAELLPQLRLDGSLTYTHATHSFSPEDIDESYTGSNHVQLFEGGQFVNEEKEISGLIRRPELTATAGLNYRPSSRLGITASTSFVGANDDIFYSAVLGPFGAVDRKEVDRYNLTDLKVSYRIGSRLTLMAKSENIFDTDYTEINGYATRGRSFFIKAKYRLSGF